MKSLLLVADTPGQLTQLRELLGTAYTLFTAASSDEALEYLRLTRIDVVVAALEHGAAPIAGFFAQAKALQPHCVTFYVAPALPSGLSGAEQEPPASDFLLRRPFGGSELHQALAQALDKQRLLEELAALRGQGQRVPPSAPPANSGELSLARIGQILRNFTRAFSTNFDSQQTLHLFVEAISEFLHPSRLSIMVRNPTSGVFAIQAHRGLAPKVAEQLRLRADEGLPHWLLTTGRMVHHSEVESQLHTPLYLEMHREMQALKAVVSMPLLASGTLVGILNLGERITGVPYTEAELEILFSLASQVAVGIQDITLYQAVQAQKVFIEKTLRYMSSGVISIGRDERISLCNHRAAEVLGKAWSEVLQEDLRSLPSPLGDLLYETLHDGKTYCRYEVLLAAGKVPLEVNTYQVLNEQGEVSGSVMVFDDLTFQKLLSEERRRADQLDFLNKVVGRMAHEIKNPLVSIQTFVELLAEHYNDPEFKDYFRAVVSRDVRAINGITEKLVSFASKISYRFELGDVQAALQRLVTSLVSEHPLATTAPHAPQGTAATDGIVSAGVELAPMDQVLLVRFDAEQFHKALMYLAIFLLQGSDDGGKLLVSAHLDQRGHPPYSEGWVSITLRGQGRKLPPAELQQLFDPFCMEQSTLVDVGPCVSQKIIEEHGGHLDVRREANGDTTFVIALPTAPAPAEVHARWTMANVL